MTFLSTKSRTVRASCRTMLLPAIGDAGRQEARTVRDGWGGRWVPGLTPWATLCRPLRGLSHCHTMGPRARALGYVVSPAPRAFAWSYHGSQGSRPGLRRVARSAGFRIVMTWVSGLTPCSLPITRPGRHVKTGAVCLKRHRRDSMKAQGNALGEIAKKTFESPARAIQSSHASLIESPLQGYGRDVIDFPWRCPGLSLNRACSARDNHSREFRVSSRELRVEAHLLR
jgi:hypothetical protein